MPVYVSGVLSTRNTNLPLNITVLIEVPEKMLQAQLKSGSKDQKEMTDSGSAVKSDIDELLSSGGNDGSSASNGMREWNDRTGKFSIQAKLISSDGSEVVLKRADGKVIKIQKSKLSDADQRYLDRR